MEIRELKVLLDVAAGRKAPDLVIRGALVADVFSGLFREADVAIEAGRIAGIAPVGQYEGLQTFDASGAYLLPALIDGHIHVESSFLTPRELGHLLVLHGTGTIISDPHEIVNVCGIPGLEFMLEEAEKTAADSGLDIRFMLPSCVPVTAFEDTGSPALDAPALERFLKETRHKDRILGLGEMMGYPAVIAGEDETLEKLLLAQRAGRIIDGHSPGVLGRDLNAYAAAGIATDHECRTVEEMQERIALGMYVLLRQGSACHDLERLLPALTKENSRRCVLCSDDLHPETILEKGHIDNLLRICVAAGLEPIEAIRMASLNASECYGLSDRGAIAPGRRADIILVNNLRDFTVEKVWLRGVLQAQNGKMIAAAREPERAAPAAVLQTMRVKGWTKDALRRPLSQDQAWVIGFTPGSLITDKKRLRITRDAQGCFVYDPGLDVAKITVVERHRALGKSAAGLIQGFGIRAGAIAQSIAHDSHNIICLGVNDDDMALALERLIASGGGVVLAKEGVVIEELPLPIAGLMSERDGGFVAEKLAAIKKASVEDLGLKPEIDPLISLAFMSLIVLPHLKITCRGLFDVDSFCNLSD
jgi:adenine deaminase